jgi:hypothetical protein
MVRTVMASKVIFLHVVDDFISMASTGFFVPANESLSDPIIPFGKPKRILNFICDVAA